MEIVWYVLASLLGVAGVVTLALWVHQLGVGAEVSPTLVVVGAAELVLTCVCVWVAESRHGKS